MKRNYELGLLALFLAFNVSVVAQNDCEKDISTNPDQPYNNHPFPSNTYNPWINSDFDIGRLNLLGNVEDIPINDALNWGLNTTNFAFNNPYTSSGTTSIDGRYNYLHPAGVDFPLRDYHWEDGWELLHVGLGFYPNGEPINTFSANRAYSNEEWVPSNPNVPYMIFYNRYRGTLRLFANLFIEFGNYSDIHTQLVIEDDSPLGLSGILRHLEPFDRPLDQPTNVIRLESFNPNSGGPNRWFSADFQLGYDPCTCGKNQEWFFNFFGIDEFDLEMSGRGIEVEMPIADDQGNPNYDTDWLSTVGQEDGLEVGNQIFTLMDGLIEDYIEALDKYEQDAASYADYQEKKDILDAFKNFIVDGTTDFFAGPLKSFLKPRDGSELSTEGYIKGASKGLLGYGYNHLSMAINPKKGSPKPPDMPTASYSELQFSGTIQSFSEPAPIGPFFIPGSYDESSALSNLDAFNYPAYNAHVGLSALLRTPEPLFYFESQPTIIEVTQDYDEYNPSQPFDYSCLKKEAWTNQTSFDMRFDQGIDVALNSSLDFDFDRTGTYLMIELTVSNQMPETYNDFFKSFEIEMSGGNLGFDSEIISPASRKYIYKSEWVLLEDLNQMVFSMDLLSSAMITKYGSLEWDPDEPYCIDPNPWPVENLPNFTPSSMEIEVDNITFKIAHDYYFDQIGTNGDQVNTFQVFSYLMYDKDAGINNFADESTWSTLTADFEAYIPGEVTLGSELIDTNHPAVTSVQFNGGLVIDAQRVVITDGLNIANGYTLTINALEDIRIEPGVQLSPSGAVDPRIHLNIKKDFYDTPIFEYVDDASSFCGINGDYQANIPTVSIGMTSGTENSTISTEKFSGLNINKKKVNLEIYPNPARDLLILKSSNVDMKLISIHDLSGRIIQQENLPNQTRQYQMSLSGIAPGTYIVRVDCNGEVFSEKLILAR